MTPPHVTESLQGRKAAKFLTDGSSENERSRLIGSAVIARLIIDPSRRDRTIDVPDMDWALIFIIVCRNRLRLMEAI